MFILLNNFYVIYPVLHRSPVEINTCTFNPWFIDYNLGLRNTVFFLTIHWYYRSPRQGVLALVWIIIGPAAGLVDFHVF